MRLLLFGESVGVSRLSAIFRVLYIFEFIMPPGDLFLIFHRVGNSGKMREMKKLNSEKNNVCELRQIWKSLDSHYSKLLIHTNTSIDFEYFYLKCFIIILFIMNNVAPNVDTKWSIKWMRHRKNNYWQYFFNCHFNLCISFKIIDMNLLIHFDICMEY